MRSDVRCSHRNATQSKALKILLDAQDMPSSFFMDFLSLSCHAFFMFQLSLIFMCLLFFNAWFRFMKSLAMGKKTKIMNIKCQCSLWLRCKQIKLWISSTKTVAWRRKQSYEKNTQKDSKVKQRRSQKNKLFLFARFHWRTAQNENKQHVCVRDGVRCLCMALNVSKWK